MSNEVIFNNQKYYHVVMEKYKLTSPIFPHSSGKNDEPYGVDPHWKLITKINTTAVTHTVYDKELSSINNNKAITAKWISSNVKDGNLLKVYMYETTFGYPNVGYQKCPTSLTFGYAASDQLKEIKLNGQVVHTCTNNCRSKNLQKLTVAGDIVRSHNTFQFVFNRNSQKSAAPNFLFQFQDMKVDLESCASAPFNINDFILDIVTYGGLVIVVLFGFYFAYTKLVRKDLFSFKKKKRNYEDRSITNSKSALSVQSKSSTSAAATSFLDDFLRRLSKTGLKVEIITNGVKKDQILFMNSKGDLLWPEGLFPRVESTSNLKQVYSRNIDESFVMTFNSGTSVQFNIKKTEFPFSNALAVVYFSALIEIRKRCVEYVQAQPVADIPTDDTVNQEAENVYGRLVRRKSFSRRIGESIMKSSAATENGNENSEEISPRPSLLSRMRSSSFSLKKIESNTDEDGNTSTAGDIAPKSSLLGRMRSGSFSLKKSDTTVDENSEAPEISPKSSLLNTMRNSFSFKKIENDDSATNDSPRPPSLLSRMRSGSFSLKKSNETNDETIEDRPPTFLNRIRSSSFTSTLSKSNESSSGDIDEIPAQRSVIRMIRRPSFINLIQRSAEKNDDDDDETRSEAARSEVSTGSRLSTSVSKLFNRISLSKSKKHDDAPPSETSSQNTSPSHANSNSVTGRLY